MQRRRRHTLVLATTAALVGALVHVPGAASAGPAEQSQGAPSVPAASTASDPTALRAPSQSPTVTIAGSLQSELGCAADWDPTCTRTDLAPQPGGRYQATWSIPAGNYEFKVTIDHSWDENYGLGGVRGAEQNIPLVLAADAKITFDYDPDTHLVALSSADLPSRTVTRADRKLAQSSLRSDLTRERFYFVMADRFANGDSSNDKGGYTGDRLVTGYDPTDKGFYHGGDLKGLTSKLDYIKGMGTTAIWLTPSFKNRPVQGSGDDVSAGYHGYWITDFTQIDPHLGTNAELKTLIDTAHAKGMKVFFDIITNHTADIIDNTQGQYTYIPKADKPYLDAAGKPFDDSAFAAGNSFPALTEQSFPYTPTFRAEADKSVKVPAWLNDPQRYHNRGNAAFDGSEGDKYGDFVGLDDLWTEQPAVRDGMIDIYSYWAKFGVDGFRIDTVKHVNTEFWQKFIPAVNAAAAAAGKPKFFQFGEVYDGDPANMSYYTTTAKLQATLDFGLQSRATGFGLGKPTAELAALYAADDYYTDSDSNAYSLPTFLGNHDMGRIGYFLAQGGSTGSELLQRDLLTQKLMFLTRGQPVTYYGDEQGFAGTGGDKDSRQDMFASKVTDYNSQPLIGSTSSTAVDNFSTTHPIYRELAALSTLRGRHPALADGAQIPRYSSSAAGVFAVSRIDAKQQIEYVVATNNATSAKTVTIDTFNPRTQYRAIYGAQERLTSSRDGQLTITVPALSAVVWQAAATLKNSRRAPEATFVTPTNAGVVGGRAPISVAIPTGGFNQVTFAWRPAGGSTWTTLGTDDNPPYRVFHDTGELAKGTVLEYRAVVKDHSGNTSAVSSSAVVGDPAPPTGGGGDAQNDPPASQPSSVTIAGDLQSELGCPGDWQPECAATQLTLDPKDQIWKGTFTLPAGGTFQYKAALNGSWAENYGANAKRDGGNIAITVPAGGKITFYYDHATHWVTSTAEGPIITAPGSAQSELGCPGDWSPDCMRPWLQDPDGDGVYTFSTAKLPPGSYETKAAHGLSWDENYGENGAPGGANIGFSAAAGAVVTYTYTLSTHVLTVSTSASTAADLSQQKAQWIRPGLIGWNAAGANDQWHYRLYYAPTGGLGLDATALTGGTYLPLRRDAAGLPAAVTAKHPHLKGLTALRLPEWVLRDRKLLQQISSGQIAVAAFDDAGNLTDATGVQLPLMLDALYASANNATLGPVVQGRNTSLSVWAPTAKTVNALVTPLGAAQLRVPMQRNDSTGIWSVKGNPRWIGARYLFEVTVYVPSTGKIETNSVTDPYSIALTTNSTQSVLADLNDPALLPGGWKKLAKPTLAQPSDSSIYELHIRDFSINDQTVPAQQRGTYLAFTQPNSDGMKHLKSLSKAGMNTLHLLPAFDIGTINEDRSQQQTPPCDLPALTAADPAGEEQQACVGKVADTDGYNWGYDPLHYTTPEGSYSTYPEGPQRTREFRQMVAGINAAGMRVVMDVVYNHTTAAGQDAKSVLDRIVPGYYHRLSATGALETSTCCANTATEHVMMNKLTVDSILTWARDYKIDGFRFDLMGHMPKQSILDVRAALNRLTPAKDGVDGKQIYLYGEGWDFGEVQGGKRFVQAIQTTMAGTDVGTFNDRVRDAVRGGGPFDENPTRQGFGTGLFTDPNAGGANGSSAEQKAALLAAQDRIKVALTGNLAAYQLVDANGKRVQGKDIDYNGQPTGYTAQPSETINYVDAHDNETLFDALVYKLPVGTSMADRVRMNTLSLATVALGQGPMFWHAGADLLRSKSLDRDSYNSGDWFNRIDWTGTKSAFGAGLPPKQANEAKWPFMKPLLANPELKPGAAHMQTASANAHDLLKLRFSTPLLRLGDAASIQQKVGFLTSGPDQAPGVIAMQVDDRISADRDPKLSRIVVVFNASPQAQAVAVPQAGSLRLSGVQAVGSDPVVKTARVTSSGVTVPARTVAVFVQPQS